MFGFFFPFSFSKNKFVDKTVSFARQDFILKSRHYLIGLIIQNSKYKNSSTAEGGGREKKSENYTKHRKAGGGGCRRERREGAEVPGKPRDDVSSQTEGGRGQHRPAASLLVNTLSADIRRCSPLAQQLQLSRERPPPRAQPRRAADPTAHARRPSSSRTFASPRRGDLLLARSPLSQLLARRAGKGQTSQKSTEFLFSVLQNHKGFSA